MKCSLSAMIVVAGFLAITPAARAQKAPEAGYIFPAGGKAGTVVNVQLGGYDWTPDMEFFVHDKRVQLIPTGPLSPILIPPPPYWFGAKGRIAALPIPREISAKLVIPADVPPGPIHWQAANANGCTSAGVFIVGSGIEVVEEEHRATSQPLPALPMTVTGRLFKNEEVDRYQIVATKDGPISCDLLARRLGSKFHPVVSVRDSAGRLVVDAVGTSGGDPSLTFAAKAGTAYVVSVHDIDFGGDRSFSYRLCVTPGARVVGAIPAAGKRGETREVDFLLHNGSAKLESIKRKVAFPAVGSSFEYRLDDATSFRLLLSDLPELASRNPAADAARLAGPTGVTGVLDQPDTQHRYSFDAKKGQVWSLNVDARRIGSPLDVSLSVQAADGKEVAKNDDLPETTDAGLDFIVPADGTYQIVVSDTAGRTGIYRLALHEAAPGFTLQTALQRINIPLGGKLDLAVTAIRKGGFKGPIELTVTGLPEGVSIASDAVIAKDKLATVISLVADKDAGITAGLVTIVGKADLTPLRPGFFSRPELGINPHATMMTRSARAVIARNLAPHSPDENRVAAVMVASTFKSNFKGRPFDADTGRKVHRGSTFPAEVIIERLDGFNGEIVLQMAATQSYQVQGITGGDVVVPPGVKQTLYPVYMPEWLETIRTSRLGMIGVAKVPDPKGKIRYQVEAMAGFITMTMEGALLKVSAENSELAVKAGQPFDVRLQVARLAKLTEPAKLELRLPDELAGRFKADAVIVAGNKDEAIVRITPTADLVGLHTFSIRATAMQEGRYPAISEAAVVVELLGK